MKTELKLMVIQGEIKIKLIKQGLTQEQANLLAGEIMQLFLDFLEGVK